MAVNKKTMESIKSELYCFSEDELSKIRVVGTNERINK